MKTKSNMSENKLNERAYQIINEIIPYLQDIGIQSKHQPIINDLAAYMEDCFFANISAEK